MTTTHLQPADTNEQAPERPALSLVKDTPAEGTVLPATRRTRGRVAAVARRRAAALPAYGAQTARGYRTLARRWATARHDDHPQMIRSAKAALRAAKGDLGRETECRELITARRVAYRQHKLNFWAKTGGWTVAAATGTATGVAFGGGWIDLLMALAAAGVGAWHGRPGAEEPASIDSTTPDAPAAIDSASYLPDTLDALGRISLVKRDPAVIRGESDVVTALIKAGIINERQRDETHLVGAIRPDGPGWTATIELPRGVVAADAMSKVGDLASALRIKKNRIELRLDTSGEGHEGRLVLWVANEDNPFGTGKTPSPLAEAERWSLWNDGVPLGSDARAVLHTMHLLWSSLLIGGLMDYGKTYLARLVAAAAALDPTVRVIVITGKTGADWAPLKHIAHRWIAGADENTIHKVLDVIGGVIAEMQERGDKLERLYESDPEKVPEGKITPELAATGMGPVLLIVDELQELLDGAALVRVVIDRDPESGKATTRPGKEVMVESFARFVRVTRFVGGMGVFITQRPDASSVPTALREVCAKRGCFRVKGDRSSRMVLGDDAVAAGAAPHLLTEDSKGVVVLDQGAEDGHVTVKTNAIDLPQFREICLRGRRLREEAKTLTGDAVEYGKNAAAAAAAAELRDDCTNALKAAGLDRARSERLLEVLVAYREDVYGDLTVPQLQARLRDAGVGKPQKIGSVDGLVNPNGYTLDQLIK